VAAYLNAITGIEQVIIAYNGALPNGQLVGAPHLGLIPQHNVPSELAPHPA
jgi:hypothetical protein